jgi:predicted metal-dependent phosphoesterase TrpH
MEAARPTFDLQSHSQHSDGALVPADVVAAAAESGVELLALTDHDSVEGVAEALAAARARGLRLIEAVEITAIDEQQRDLHVLGYAIDHTDHLLRERLSTYRGQRENRADEIADAIRGLGFALEESPLQERAAQGKSIGRPHLADAVVAHPANAKRLAEEQLEDRSAFLVAYLIEGKPAFVPRRGPSVAESINTIHDGRGMAIWAHPFWDIKDVAEVLSTIDAFIDLGLDGVECFYPTHTHEQTGLLAQRCEARRLLSTGSSDFHGPQHREFSAFRAFDTYGYEPRLGPLAG